MAFPSLRDACIISPVAGHRSDTSLRIPVNPLSIKSYGLHTTLFLFNWDCLLEELVNKGGYSRIHFQKPEGGINQYKTSEG